MEITEILAFVLGIGLVLTELVLAIKGKGRLGNIAHRLISTVHRPTGAAIAKVMRWKGLDTAFKVGEALIVGIVLEASREGVGHALMPMVGLTLFKLIPQPE